MLSDKIDKFNNSCSLKLLLVLSLPTYLSQRAAKTSSPTNGAASNDHLAQMVKAVSASKLRRAQIKVREISLSTDVICSFGQFHELETSGLQYARQRDGSYIIREERDFGYGEHRDTTLARVQDVAATLYSNDIDSSAGPVVTAVATALGFHDYSDTVSLFVRTPTAARSIQTLRSYLSRSPKSLDRRLYISKMISKAVFYTHAFSYVHKNIHTSNILVLESDPSANAGRTSAAWDIQIFLVGYCNARSYSAPTREMSPRMPKNLGYYLHPERGQKPPAKKYNFLHDMYSLGVCLMEIGYREVIPRRLRDWESCKQGELDKRLKVEARNLSTAMGHTFADVVTNCLEGFPIERGQSREEMDLTNGVRYVDRVLSLLDRIKL